MSSPAPLLVPLVVDAFACSYPAMAQDNVAMRSWTPNPNPYKGPRAHDVPEADGGNLRKIDGTERLGVYVQWRLPRALMTFSRTAAVAGERPAMGRPDLRGLPLVPNRWLIIRYSRTAGDNSSPPAATGWLLHSDHLSDEPIPGKTGDLVFPHPDKMDPEPAGYPPAPFADSTYVGRRFDLADPEDVKQEASCAAAAQRGFLTAAGPGLPAFAHFQCYNNNVFSLHDTTADLHTKPKTRHTLSYLVTGWYAAAADDLLAAGGNDLAARLDALGWSHPKPPKTKRSLYTGTVLGLDWYPDAEDVDGKPHPAPASGFPKNPAKDVRVAVADTVIDSAAALLPKDDKATTASVEAFAHGWLLDTHDPLTEADFDIRRHAARFRSAASTGYRWTITDRPDQQHSGPTDPTAEAHILHTLNTLQHHYDIQLFAYAEVLHRLHDAWLLAGRDTRPDAYRALLDPADQASLLDQAITLDRDLFGPGGYQSQIPWGATTADLDAAIARHEQHVKLPAHRRLVRTPLPPFHHPLPTALSLHGVSADNDPVADGPLPLRTPEELITAITGISASGSDPCPKLPSTLPADVAGHLPALVRELRLLDAAQQAGKLPDKANQVTGQLPPYLRSWHQPWQPLFVRWTVQATALPYRTLDGTQHWTYQREANRYQWDGKHTYATAPKPDWHGQALSGITYLDALYPALLAGRAAQHAATYSTTLRIDTDDLAGHDVLSIPLEGLPEWLLRRTPGRPLRPPLPADPADPFAALAHLLAPPGTPGEVPPAYSPPDSPRLDHKAFTPVRAAQFTFHSLEVVDRFGRALSLIDTSNYRTGPVDLVIADGLNVGSKPAADLLAQDENDKLTAELQPRLATGARLRFDGVDARDDTRVIDPARGWDGDHHPVCGWIMISRLGKSLMFFSPTGQALGEMRTVQQGTQHHAQWQPLPDSPYPRLDTPAFAHDLPHLHTFATALAHTDARRLDGVCAYINQRLATTATPPPTGDARHLAFLVGTPLALLRTRLRLETDTLAPTDPADSDQLAHPSRATPPEQWHLHLGHPGHTDDGLIGHTLPGDDQHLIVPDTPHTADPTGYLTTATGQELRTSAHPVTGQLLAEAAYDASPAATDLHLTVLAHPGVPVHAHTSILPATALALPGHYLAQAYRSLTAYFPLGPLLAPTTPGANDLVVPAPAWSGMRQWAQPPHPTKTATGFSHHPLTPYTPTTPYTTPPPEAHTGYLNLTVPNEHP
ncbi:hypothetical protein ACIQU6_17300 [Streptomyces sp. NPDC090442]|uniref:hypothetical protein n=1 Tax=Streptomyces sp. NPDC090442 TaxID=3365962 RepID=UPI00380FB007